MKKHILALAVFLFTLTLGQSQTNVYHPFPTKNAFWGDDGWNIFYWYDCYNTRYGLNGDTIINGMNYSKVYSLYDSTLTNPLSKYCAAIREQDKRIYLATADTNSKQVLYDFNLSVGDTIVYPYSISGTPGPFSRVLTKIDSIHLHNGQYRKRYCFASGFNCAHPDTVVEGIGSICWVGLFNPLVNDICLCGEEYAFRCFKQNDTVVYLDNPSCKRCFCTLLTSIKNNVQEQGKVLIFPNPFVDYLTIENDRKFSNNSYYQISNILGQTMMSGVFKDKITLNLKEYTQGIYLLRIVQEDNESLNFKLMKK